MRGRLRARAFLLYSALVAVLLGLGAVWSHEARVAGAMPRVLLTSWVLSVPATATTPARSEAVRVPGHFDAIVPRTPVDIVFRTAIVVPPELRDEDLTLSVPYAIGRETLRVNGQRTTAMTDDLVDGYRSRGPQEFRIPRELAAAGGALAFELTVASTWSQASWLDTIPRLHRARDRDPHTLFVRVVDDVVAAFALGTLFQIGITYLTAFQRRQKLRAYVFFAIQILAASYIHVFYLGLTEVVLGTYDIAGVCIFLAIAPVASVYFTHAQFNLPPPSRAWLALLALDIVVAITVPGPFAAQYAGVPLTLGSISFVVLYQLFTLTRLAAKRPRPFGVELVLACWVVLGLTSIDDVPAWLGFGQLFGGAHGACVGLSLFAIFQSLLLGREHTDNMQHTDDLNLVLAQRVDDLETRERENVRLNDELRRQVSDRSRQLFAALSLVGGRTEDPPRLPNGTLVQGRYRITGELGEGGMGTVYRVVRQPDLVQLALKVTQRTDGASLARLAREAQVASTFAHPNVVGVVDVDIESSGYLYIVLEYVEGPTLAAESAKFGDVAWALPLLAQMARGLAALHAHGIVHRDFKPANVLLATTALGAPLAKVTDFGISRLTLDKQSTVTIPPPRLGEETSSESGDDDAEALVDDAGDTVVTKAPPGRRPERNVRKGPELTPSRTPSYAQPALTEAGVLMGTPVYMAPELALDPDRISPAADVFSLGLVAYEMLAGARAFAVPPVVARLRNRPVLPAPSLARAGSTLPAEVVLLVDAALSLDPALRPTAQHFADRLSAVLAAAAPSSDPDHSAA